MRTCASRATATATSSPRCRSRARRPGATRSSVGATTSTWPARTDRSLGDGDVGRVRWDGEDLVETGELTDDGRVVSYTEVWRRVAGGDGGLESHWSPDGGCVVVRTGDHVLTIADDRPAGGAYRACYRTRHEGRWAVELALGAGAIDLPASADRARSWTQPAEYRRRESPSA